MAKKPVKRSAGRPPEGLGKKGEPSRISEYPRLSVTIRPHVKARLAAVAELQDRPAWLVVEDALAAYFASLPEAEKGKSR